MSHDKEFIKKLTETVILSIISNNFIEAMEIFESVDISTRYELELAICNIRTVKDTKLTRRTLERFIPYEGLLIVY